MSYKIRKAAVIGSGVMGSAIAGYLAGVGIPCHLLDIVPEGAKDRDTLAKGAIKKLVKSKPPALFSPNDTQRIIPGNIEDHLDRLAEVDWIVEAVVEKLDIKVELFKKIQEHRREGTIISSNTSGISIKDMGESLPEEFRRHFLITHFFNPVRYMRLLEIVPGPDTKSEVVDFMSKFGDEFLGKGIVYAKDTPNFIANRIGVFGKLLTIHEMVVQDAKVEDIDRVFGVHLGRPKSAVFRTADIVGLDTTANVVNYLAQALTDDPAKDIFVIPEFYQKMLDQGMLGQKAKQGFYKVEKKEDGSKNIKALDWKTLEYVDQEKKPIESVEATKGIKDLEKRLKAFLMDQDDFMAKFAWKMTFKTMIYGLTLVGEISDDIVNIDRAMKWGYNWEIGLFETWDAIGVEDSVKRMGDEGYELPDKIEEVLATPQKRFYIEEDGVRKFFDFESSSYKPVDEPDYLVDLKTVKKGENKVVYNNPSATLIDMEDGVLGVEFHGTPTNMVDDDVVKALDKAVELAEESYRGILIANQGSNFCVGANLFLIMMNAQQQNWDELGKVIDQFQQANQRLRYCRVPVVAAPFGMTLGGGCEVAMAADRIHAAAETYMGLVEVGVGLIPAGAGCLNMLKRYLSHIPNDVTLDTMPLVRQIFEIVGMGKVAVSAKQARDFKFLKGHDTITFNPDQLIHQAKQAVIGMAASGYRPEEPWGDFKLPGGDGVSMVKAGLHEWKTTGVISEHDALVGEKLANVLCGGDVGFRTELTEQHILDLEKEAFLSLAGEPKSQERMQYMLQNKKPLRN